LVEEKLEQEKWASNAAARWRYRLTCSLAIFRLLSALTSHLREGRRRTHHLAAILLLTYALRNADCHAKNIALLYTSRADVHLSPAYDFLTTSVYARYQNNPPGISFGGKKTWTPGKNLSKFIAATFGIPLREQSEMVEHRRHA
jgi:serine/threonine-protein kinase HipA